MAKADFVTSIIVVLLGLGAFITSLRMPRFEHLSIDPYTVPGIVPGILGVVLFGLGIILFVRSILRGGWRIDLQGITITLLSPTIGRLVVVLGLTLGYAIGLVGRMPYWLATTIFVFLFIVTFEWMMAANARGRALRLASASVMAVVVAVAVTLVFQELFLVRLP